jgi:probable F420-dependent oxidoreductase
MWASDPAYYTARAWSDRARKAEDLGYSVMLASDHLGPSLAPMLALTAAAMATRTLRLGTLVLNQDFRHPAILAKEAATLDLLSDGRLELGLGAGWAAEEYRWAGIAFDPASVRVSRFAEYVTAVKAILSQQLVTLSGEHFSLDEMPGLPRPRQTPRPTLLLGGSGERMIRLAAREADIVSLALGSRMGRTDLPDARPAAVDRKVRAIRDAAGARLQDLELNVWVASVAVTNDPLHAAEQALAGFKRIGSDETQAMSVYDFRSSPHVLIGTSAELVEKLFGIRERYGVSYLTVPHPALEQFAPVVAELTGR